MTVTAGCRDEPGQASGHIGLAGQAGSPAPSPQLQLALERLYMPSQRAVLLVYGRCAQVSIPFLRTQRKGRIRVAATAATGEAILAVVVQR